ncbi:MAG: MATE family efflux transporter, partial [Oscillospiraceae bacterium]|nr:MATE family efflux transporter [Oscillospiraceae bacterium]
KDADRKMIFFNVVCCLFMTLLMVLVGRFFPEIYKTHQSVKDLAGKFILISALAMPLCAFTHSTYFTLRSGGNTLITFLFDSVYTWVFLIPFAYVLSYHTSLSIITDFFLVQFTELIKVVIGYFMIKGGSWAQNIVNK